MILWIVIDREFVCYNYKNELRKIGKFRIGEIWGPESFRRVAANFGGESDMLTKVQKVQRNGLITIPKEIRDRVQLNEGDLVETQLQPQGIVIRVFNLGQNRYKNFEA